MSHFSYIDGSDIAIKGSWSVFSD